ncbi:MAG: hypothetical protein WA810_03820, partial [Maribacter sp.]
MSRKDLQHIRLNIRSTDKNVPAFPSNENEKSSAKDSGSGHDQNVKSSGETFTTAEQIELKKRYTEKDLNGV